MYVAIKEREAMKAGKQTFIAFVAAIATIYRGHNVAALALWATLAIYRRLPRLSRQVT